MADATEFEDEGGVVRRLGNLRTTKKPAKAWPVYGTTPQTPVFERKDWRNFIDIDGLGHNSFFLPPTHDQNGYGMCNCSATAGAMESQRTKQGLPYKKLSAGDLYRRICYMGGDNGSLLEDGLRTAMKEGIASVATVPYLDWRHEFPGAEEEREKYAVTKAYLCPTFEHCISAVLQGYDLISGIEWYRNYTPDEDGWLPRGAGDVGGHAVHGYKATYRKSGSRYEYGIWHQNSWGESWGLQGRCVFPESAYDGQVGGWWAVVQVIQTSDDE